MKKNLLLFLLLLLFSPAITCQQSLLQSGPMLGYSEMKEVLLWVQTKESAKVRFEYWIKGDAIEKYQSKSITTQEEYAFTAKIIANKVEPGQTYSYDLFINEEKVSFDYPTEFQTQELWQFRTDPPQFTIALGSCAYVNETVYDRPGTPYGGEYEIFTALHQKRPDAMLWLGDNTYLREVDWYTRTGILHRHTHTRSLPELQPLLASTHHYAIWDDHDFGPNNSDGSFVHKDKTLEAFQLFWGNPSYGIPDVNGGITSFFQWSDVDFFLLDNRYFRNSNYLKKGPKTMLGQAQIDWLLNALTKSQAPFKMVAIGGQVLNTSPSDETYIHHFAEERAYLIKRIQEEDIRNVIILNGDRHHTELSMLEDQEAPTIYDLTVSPLTSGAHRNPEKDNTLRVKGTIVNKRNFGILEFSGPRREREMKISIYDVAGKEIWSRTIKSE